MEDNNSMEDIIESNEIKWDVDYGYLFTRTIFTSREELISWVQKTARANDMVIIIARSDNADSKRCPRMTLVCERAGKFRETKNSVPLCNMESVGESDIGKEKGKKATGRSCGTKKCGCQFKLQGKQIALDGQWELKVVYGTHNHPIGQFLEGHSFAGRLSHAQDAFVLKLSDLNTQPLQILDALKKEWPDTKATLTHIYNARLKHRVVERKGRSQMQYLMGKLEENKYSFHHRRCEKTNLVKDVFFAHPTSVELLHAFPFVLFMDCTYKTNVYKLPLLEIIGVTSTGMSFVVAFAYMESKREDNYMWACSNLKDLMQGYCLPKVIITDRELALVNAVESTFPSTTHLLCKWHIRKNVLAKCKKREFFSTNDEWKLFYSSFGDVIDAENEENFTELLLRFQSVYMKNSMSAKAAEYCMKQWITPYKQKFVSAYTNKVMHYDNVTTNRVESNHAKLKRCLKTSQGNFETCWYKIHSLLETSHITIKASLEKSVNVVQHKFKPSIFKVLRGEISIKALDMILEEMETRSCDDPLLCGCNLRKTCGLPCSHEISKFKLNHSAIPLDMIDHFWKKLDLKPIHQSHVSSHCPSSSQKVGPEPSQWVKDDFTTRLNDTLEDVAKKFSKENDSERLLILKRLREIVNPTTTSLLEPQLKKKSRGRPKMKHQGKNKSTKREKSAFEYVGSIVESCSQGTIEFGGPVHVTPMFSDAKGKKQEIRRKVVPPRTIKDIDLLPSWIRGYVLDTVNVKGDGHCGFRAIADQMNIGEDEWGKVRYDLIEELTLHRDLYIKVFLHSEKAVDDVMNRLRCFDTFATEYNWFMLPEMGHLVASKYNVILVIVSNSACLTFLPFRTVAPPDPKCICIALLQEEKHFISVKLKMNHPVPHIAHPWENCRDECAETWMNFCESPRSVYYRLIGFNPNADAEVISID